MEKVRNDAAGFVVTGLIEVINANRAYLSEIDGAIGDGDHGINMDRGMRAALAKIEPLAAGDIGTLLKTVGMALVSSVGGAAGPLYGTFFLQLGTATARMAAAAEQGRDSTRDLVARVGRASRLGERSRGVLDAGATSCALLLQSTARSLEKALKSS